MQKDRYLLVQSTHCSKADLEAIAKRHCYSLASLLVGRDKQGFSTKTKQEAETYFDCLNANDCKYKAIIDIVKGDIVKEVNYDTRTAYR